MNAYSVNHMTRSIILTSKFAKAASTPDTKEYRILIKLRTDNPGYDIIKRTIAKKEGKRKPPSYKQMKKYISCVENSDYYEFCARLLLQPHDQHSVPVRIFRQEGFPPWHC